MIARCLQAFLGAGTLDVSLDQLAAQIHVSKRMLVHYFGGRAHIEVRAIGLLEESLRAQLSPSNFPKGASLQTVVQALWERSTAPESRGALLLVMDMTRRAWNGSEQARSFYLQQQRIWIELLSNFSSDQGQVRNVLQLFQGALLTFLITGDADLGESALRREAMRTVINKLGRKRGATNP